ncbi:MAG: MaoC family dehydratase [Candidatus Tectomicrobia bacterium]|nr:MaoC family dehydratase [Candidatus Tectomicrobia bacterium]
MFTEFVAGTPLPVRQRLVTQEKINAYAEASGDHNPIHTDPEFAKTTMYGGTIAHGLYTLAFLSEMLGSVFGPAWLSGGSIDIAFLRPVRPGDTIRTGGAVTRGEQVEGKQRLLCEVYCENQHAEKVLAGSATIEY